MTNKVVFTTLAPDAQSSLEDGEVLGQDNDGALILWDASNGTPYNCGETPKEYGIENLTKTEILRLTSQISKAAVLKNVLDRVAVKPFYIWANGDCGDKSDCFEQAKKIRLALINDGGESVHIVDADGVEVCDAEIVCHEALAKAGYFAGLRKPEVKPEFAGAFMVNDPDDPDGFAIVGDHLGELILEAQAQLIDPPVDRILVYSQDHALTPAELDAERKSRCPKQGESELIFEVRDKYIARLKSKGSIDAKDLLDLERSGKCFVANDHWSICTKDARDALLNDAHHFVRSSAAIAAFQEIHGN